jgi:hypothetical protein
MRQRTHKVVLFLCTGNYYRSRFAEALFNAVFRIDPGTGERLGLLATATVGEGGWVGLPGPVVVRAGKAFTVVPEGVEGAALSGPWRRC